MPKFSERLKELRIDKGLTQQQLANATGISQNAIAFWENEKRIPIIIAVVKLADYFNVSVDYLVGRTDDC